MFTNVSNAYPPALPANIRQCLKSLPGTNTLAYYERALLTAVKKFYNIVPRCPLVSRLEEASVNTLH